MEILYAIHIHTVNLKFSPNVMRLCLKEDKKEFVDTEQMSKMYCVKQP